MCVYSRGGGDLLSSEKPNGGGKILGELDRGVLDAAKQF